VDALDQRRVAHANTLRVAQQRLGDDVFDMQARIGGIDQPIECLHVDG
jgi:hypothetical protein